MITKGELLALDAGETPIEDYEMACEDGRRIVIPLYYPRHELAVFLKEGLRSLDPSIAMPLVRKGLRVANVRDPEGLRAALDWTDLTGRVEAYFPVSMPQLPRTARNAVGTDEELRETVPEAAGYVRLGPDGFSQADRDRAERDLEAIRRRVERETGQDLAGKSTDEILRLANSLSLRRAYSNEPDIDGDFRKSEVTDI